MSAARIGRKAIRWLPVLLWMAAIFYLSALPDLPHHPEATMDLIIKKLAHMVAYGVLAGLALWALKGGDGQLAPGLRHRGTVCHLRRGASVLCARTESTVSGCGFRPSWRLPGLARDGERATGQGSAAAALTMEVIRLIIQS